MADFPYVSINPHPDAVHNLEHCAQHIPGLQTVQADLSLTWLGPVTAISFPNLLTVGHSFEVYTNANLKAVTVPKLETVGLANTGNSGVYFFQLQALELVDFSSLRQVGGWMLLEYLALTSLQMPKLVATGDRLTINHNMALVSIGAGSLASIGGQLECINNPVLLSLDLSELEEVSLYAILENLSLRTIELPKFLAVGGYLEVNLNAGLIGLEAPMLSAIGGSLKITENDQLSQLHLPSLAIITRGVDISDNTAMTSFECPLLVSVGGDLYVGAWNEAPGTQSVESVDLRTLETIVGNLRLYGMGPITGLFLPALETVRGDVEITQNGQLAIITMPQLHEIRGDLSLGGDSNSGGSPALSTVELRRACSILGVTTMPGTVAAVVCRPVFTLQSQLLPQCVTTTRRGARGIQSPVAPLLARAATANSSVGRLRLTGCHI